MKDFKINFAPIQGYTDYTYRQNHQECFKGINEYYSPFLRLQHNGIIRNKDIKDVEPLNNAGINFVPQIIGGDIDEMSKLFTYLVEKGYKRVDVNLGCSFKMITRSGRGAGVLNNLEKIKAILELIQSFPTLSVSLKMRLGLNSVEDSIKLLPLINKANLHSVTLHAKLSTTSYDEDVDLEGFTLFYNDCTQDLYYDGNLKTVGDIEKIRQTFPKLKGVMIGRGLLADPALAEKYENMKTQNAKFIEEESYSRFEEEEKIGKMDYDLLSYDKEDLFLKDYATFHELLFKRYSNILEGGEHQILQKMKTIWEYFLPQTDKKSLKTIKKAKNLRVYSDVVNSIFKNYEI